MKAYRYFLLDWDGNLARTLEVWLEALRVPLARRGYHFSDAEIGANFTDFRLRMQGKVDDLDAIIDEAKEITLRKTPSVELYPDALKTLEYLHTHNKRVALVTTSSHAQVDHLLEKHGMQHLFDAIVCGDDVTHNKPHAEPLEKALKLLHGSKENAVMVGDSGTDIEAANNASIDSVLFYPPNHATFYDLEELKLLSPTYIIDDFKELMRLP